MPAKLSNAEARRRVVEISDGELELVSEYVSGKGLQTFRCASRGHTFERPYGHIMLGFGCKVCYGKESPVRLFNKTLTQLKECGARVELLEVYNLARVREMSPDSKMGASMKYRCLDCNSEHTAEIKTYLFSTYNCPSCALREVGRTNFERVASTVPDRIDKATVGRFKFVPPYLGGSELVKAECTNCGADKEVTLTQWLSDYQRCWSCEERVSTNGYSLACIEWLDHLSAKYSIRIQHATNGGEKRIVLPGGKKTRVDGFCEELNLIFEYHGDDWHGNPAKHPSGSYPHPFKREVSAGILYANTLARDEALRFLGYGLVTLWESDYWASEWEDLIIPDHLLTKNLG